MQTDWQRAESGGGCQWSRSASSCGDLALVAPTNKNTTTKRLDLEVYAGNQTSLDLLGIAEAVQPQIHSCAPTDAFLFGSGHFQDHRAVVMEFSPVATTSLQVTNDCRPAICDRQLLAQESVQCLLQQWWQATPLKPTGLTPNQGEALLAKWMRHGLRCVAPQSKQKPRHVTEIGVAAENGDLKPLYQFFQNAKMSPKVAMPLFLPSGAVATTPQEVASVWLDQRFSSRI